MSNGMLQWYVDGRLMVGLMVGYNGMLIVMLKKSMSVYR